MPKNNKTSKNSAGVLATQKVSATHRIGSRKSGRSAHSMSTAALLAVLTNKDQRKGQPAARAVLDLRGVSYEWPVKLVTEAS